MKVKTLSAGDTAYLLRRALGSRRNWHDFLADCIRGKTKTSDPVLLPIALVKGEADRCKRPRYAAPEVAQFIRNDIANNPRPIGAASIQLIEIELSEAALALPAGMRSAKLVSSSSMGTTHAPS